ncbi:MAG: NAD-dependent epimerase/dehydratase family protein [Candidatus Rokuibacteriota bacterium]
MKYFVTGASGFIGRHVARLLLEQGHEVVALVRSAAAAQDLTRLGARAHEGDLTLKESMRGGMRGADGVFHLAAWYRVGARDRSSADSVNVNGTYNVLELMKELEIPRGVYTSSLAVFGDTRGRAVDERYRHEGPWLTDYDRTKWAAHYKVAEPMARAGLPLVIVQPGVVYGPGDTSLVRRMFVRYLRRQLPMIPRGAVYCWGHVEDTARAHVAAMEKGTLGEAYIIAGPSQSLRQVFVLAEAITGIPAPRVDAPPWLVGGLATVMGVVERFRAVPETYAPETLRATAGVTYLGNSKKASRAFGFTTRPLEEGLRETLHHEMRLLGMSPRG